MPVGDRFEYRPEHGRAMLISLYPRQLDGRGEEQDRIVTLNSVFTEAACHAPTGGESHSYILPQ